MPSEVHTGPIPTKHMSLNSPPQCNKSDLQQQISIKNINSFAIHNKNAFQCKSFDLYRYRYTKRSGLEIILNETTRAMFIRSCK